MIKNKSMDYILGMITGAAVMLAIWGCTHTPLGADSYTTELGSAEWKPMYVKIVD